MLDLIVAALRMRPDRIVVGEIRKSAQAQALFEAMHTGHSVYATMHADTVQQVKRRLVEPPISVPLAELEALHLILVEFRDRRRGLRRALELAEVLQGGSVKGDLELNYLYRWRARSDTFEKVNESIRIFEELNLHTGMTLAEIKKDLKEKEEVLQWMLDKGTYDIDIIGQIMKMYYKDKGALLSLVHSNKTFLAAALPISSRELSAQNSADSAYTLKKRAPHSSSKKRSIGQKQSRSISKHRRRRR